MPMSDGAVFAGYTIVRSLGSGEMGEVYLVRHPRLSRQEELTILPATVSADPHYRQRFNQEADLAARLGHPHIAAVRDRGEEDGHLWITVDHINGTDAATLLADKFPEGMPPKDVCEIIDALADALDHAHEQQLVHLGVSPTKILLTKRRNGPRRILLTGFGIARPNDDNTTAADTVSYSAPEQLMGEHLEDRTDQYALAATAYHLLTGTAPYTIPNTTVDISRHLNTPPPRLTDTHPALSTLDPVITKGMAKNPADRYNTCREFTQALTDATAGGHTPTARTPPIAATTTADHRPEPPITFSDWGTPRPPPTPTPTPPPLPVAPPKARWTAQAPSASQGGLQRVFVAAAVLVILLATITFAALIRPWQQDDRSANGTAGAPPSDTTMMTFAAMRDFVIGYFNDLPARPDAAWAKRSPQNQTGKGDFVDFWASMQSVTVVSVSPRDTASVVARLKYVRKDGTSKTDDAWLEIVSADGAMLLDESGQIGPVDETAMPSSPLPNASTTDVNAVRPGVYAHLAAARLARHDEYDRLVLEFADAVPGYTVGYRPLPAHADGSGREIPLPGASALVQITLTRAAADWDFENHDYQGPSTVTADTAVVTEAKEAGDFEAVLTWVVGLRAKVPFRVLVLDGPPRLVVDFQQ